MKKATFIPLMAAAVVLSAACAGSGTSEPEAKVATPVFTETEKAGMSADEKVAAYNADKADKDRVICRKKAKTGSHRKVRVCRTVAEMDAEEDAARDALRGSQGGRASAPADF